MPSSKLLHHPPSPMAARPRYLAQGFGLAFALTLVVGTGCAPRLAPLQSIDMSHPLPEGISLSLKFEAGDVTVKEGEAGAVIVKGSVQARGARGEEAAAQAYPLEFIQEGAVLSLAPPTLSKGRRIKAQGGAKKVHYKITVPPRCDVRIDALSGTIQAEGLSGDLQVSLHRGELDLREGSGLNRVSLGEGEVSAINLAHLDLSALKASAYVEGLGGGGDLEVKHGELSLVGGRGSITARVGTGSLRVESSESVGDLHLLSGEAAVDVYLPSQGRFDLMAASVTGDLWVDHPALPKGAFPRGLTQNIEGEVGERVEILSASGPISIYHIDPIPTYTARATHSPPRLYLP